MELRIKVLSLNCWGIVGISKHRKERIEHLCTYLSEHETDFDYVFLQELWSENDFKKLSEAVSHCLPYSHYFYSGVNGSGVCLLSRWPIIDTFAFKYNLNGYPHKFYHGDWFGGKVVGMAKVMHMGLIANLYVTHLHAEYDPLHDAYLFHRVSQAFEFSQFVSHTLIGSCDYAIVAGDFNTQPQDLPYKIILYNSRLRDSFEEKEMYIGESSAGASCSHPDNTYTSSYDRKYYPEGQRIDYVMYGVGNDRMHVKCEKYMSPVWKTQSGLSVSDHEPVVVILKLIKESRTNVDTDPMAFVNYLHDDRVQARIECLEESSQLMSKAMSNLRTTRYFFFLFACLLLILLICSIPVDFIADFGKWNILIHIGRIIITLLIGFCFLMGFLWNAMERSNVLSSKNAMDLLLNFLRVQTCDSTKIPIKELPFGKV